MKKYIKYLFVLFMMIIFTPNIVAKEYGFYIDTDTKEVGVDGIVEVNIYLDYVEEGVEGFDYFNTGIAFDTNIFELANDASDFEVKESWKVGNLKKLEEGVFFNVSSSEDSYAYDKSWAKENDGKYDLLVSNIKLRVKDVESQSAVIYVTTGYDDEGDERQVYYDTSVKVKINNSLKDKDSNTFLSTFEMAGVELDPKFDKEVTDYYARVPYDKSSVTIECSCEGNYCETDNEKEYNLEVGHNVIKITVKAEDESTRVYSFVIIREGKSDDTSLATLLIKDQLGSPIKFDFNSRVIKYDITVSYEVTSISYEAVCSGVNCTIDNEKGTKELEVGANQIVIGVTAEDGNTGEYRVNIIRSEAEKTFTQKNVLLIVIIIVLVLAIIIVVIILIMNNKKQDKMLDTIDSDEEEDLEE